MSIGVGIVLPLMIGGSATFFGLDRDRALYPIMMIVIASYYALFAVMGASIQVLILESAIGAAFLGVALAGFKSTLWLVVTALAAHGVFDLIHRHLYTPIPACQFGGHRFAWPMMLWQLLIWLGCWRVTGFGPMRPDAHWRGYEP